jgi:transposase
MWMRTNMDEKNGDIATTQVQQERFALPWDISDWVDRRLLREWVASELDSLNWTDARLTEYLQKHPQYRPRELLAVCVYAYATGLVESEEIADQCVREPELRQMCGGYSPSPREISRFRKENRGVIRWLLTQSLKRCLRERFGFGALIPPGLRRRIEENATERLDLARHMDRAGQGA